MKKLIRLAFLGVTITSMVISSCQKNPQNLNNSNKSSSHSDKDMLYTTQNVSSLYLSLYDSIGDMHNQDLSYIFNSIGLDPNNIPGFNYGSGTDSEITAANMQFIQTPYPNLNQGTLNHLAIVSDSIMSYYYVPDFYDKMPSILIQKVNGMLNIYYGIDDPQQEIAAIDNYFMNNINQFNDTTQALAFTAFMGTLKHSTMYWSNIFSQNNSLTLQASQTAIEEDWKAVGAADGIGALAGGWDLGCFGAVLGGPAGAVALGIVGAICGGAEASADEILVSHVVKHI